MSNKKITDLPVLSSFSDDDVIPVVDVSANVTKKSYIQDLATRFSQGLQSLLISGTNIKTINSESILGSGNVSVQDTLVSGTNIKTVNSTSLLGSGDISISANPSGVAGSIQFSDGSAFASDAANLFYDDTNNRLGVGTNAPSATTHIKGSGSTSATTAVLVQNSAGNNALQVRDDRSVGIYAFSQVCFNVGAVPNNNGGLRILTLGSGNTYLDGWSDGTSKSTNYPLIIGSRVQNAGSGITGSTTAENGTPVIFGFEVAQASALVTINSTTRGFLPPRMTTTEKNAISSPSSGLQVYDTTLNQMSYYNGSSWINF
jgi:hypothetical protein